MRMRPMVLLGLLLGGGLIHGTVGAQSPDYELSIPDVSGAVGVFTTIATILDDENCCQLLGPTKLMQGPNTHFVLHRRETAPGDAPLSTPVAAGEEVCASVDRY